MSKLLPLIFSALAVFANQSVAQIQLGVPTLPVDSPILFDDSSAGMLLRQGVGRRLVRMSESGEIRFDLASQISSGFSGELAFRLREARTEGGTGVFAEGIVNSLRDCLRQKFSKTNTFRISAGERGSTPAMPSRWIQIEIPNEIKEKELIRAIAGCDLYMDEIREVFGSQFGYGTNIQSIGDFRVVDFKPGKHFTLGRIYKDERSRRISSVEFVEIRRFSAEEAALSALRRGGFDLFFTYSQEVIARAQKDETLVAQKCSIYNVVYRKGLRVVCEPELQLAALGYAEFSVAEHE